MADEHSIKNPLWGGHFNEGPAEIMARINQSIDVDKRLYREDIEGSKAHATMLVAQSILTQEEGDAIHKGLDQIKNEIESGHFTYDYALEDIHMHIESRLKEIIGETSGKLHTARSRNDQVATDFKLWVRNAIDECDNALTKLQASLITKADAHHETIMPGYTHLQTAQPVTLGHHLLAYVEMIGRDRERLSDARARLNQCPLGSAALAGTSFPIDRESTATALGFDCPTRNSLDSTSDRDFAIEFLSTLSILAMHLSRFAEELVLWASKEFDFITLSERYTTGSSIMPQKRNPDAAELIRAKSGSIYGKLFSLLTVMKGLPLTYSKDMQEDKQPVFQAYDATILSVQAVKGMVDDMEIHIEKMRKSAERGYSTATDLADWLVQNLGLPFRDCHHITGQIVRLAESKQLQLHQLSLEAMQSIEPKITENIFSVLSVDHSVRSRTSFGGTAPSEVKKSVIDAKKRYLKE